MSKKATSFCFAHSLRLGAGLTALPRERSQTKSEEMHLEVNTRRYLVRCYACLLVVALAKFRSKMHNYATIVASEVFRKASRSPEQQRLKEK